MKINEVANQEKEFTIQNISIVKDNSLRVIEFLLFVGSDTIRKVVESQVAAVKNIYNFSVRKSDIDKLIEKIENEYILLK